MDYYDQCNIVLAATDSKSFLRIISHSKRQAASDPLFKTYSLMSADNFLSMLPSNLFIFRFFSFCVFFRFLQLNLEVSFLQLFLHWMLKMCVHRIQSVPTLWWIHFHISDGIMCSRSVYIYNRPASPTVSRRAGLVTLICQSSHFPTTSVAVWKYESLRQVMKFWMNLSRQSKVLSQNVHQIHGNMRISDVVLHLLLIFLFGWWILTFWIWNSLWEI